MESNIDRTEIKFRPLPFPAVCSLSPSWVKDRQAVLDALGICLQTEGWLCSFKSNIPQKQIMEHCMGTYLISVAATTLSDLHFAFTKTLFTFMPVTEGNRNGTTMQNKDS